MSLLRINFFCQKTYRKHQSISQENVLFKLKPLQNSFCKCKFAKIGLFYQTQAGNIDSPYYFKLLRNSLLNCACLLEIKFALMGLFLSKTSRKHRCPVLGGTWGKQRAKLWICLKFICFVKYIRKRSIWQELELLELKLLQNSESNCIFS